MRNPKDLVGSIECYREVQVILEQWNIARRALIASKYCKSDEYNKSIDDILLQLKKSVLKEMALYGHVIGESQGYINMRQEDEG